MGGSGRTLDVDTPLCGVEVEGGEGSLLAEALGLVDELVSAVVSRTWISFRVFVCERRVSVSEDPENTGMKARWQDILCITLPRASRTAVEVKFSDGIRLMKCFCLFSSCNSHIR